MCFGFTYFVPDHFYYLLIELDSNKFNQQKPDWFVEPKSIFNFKQNYRYKNLPLNCEYEFELFVEFNEQFHKAALINAVL